MRLFWMMIAVAFLPGGAVAQQMDCSAPETQTDMTLCAKQEWVSADEELNGAYQEAIAWMKRTDAALDAADRGAEEALRAGQRAWVEFRDNACLAEAYPFTGGSIQPMVQWDCMARLTWARVGDLYVLVDQSR